MTFPDVMEQGSHDHITILAAAGRHQGCGMMAMTLVGNTLGEKENGSLRCQPLRHLVAFGAVQGMGERNVEEAPDEVGRRTRVTND